MRLLNLCIIMLLIYCLVGCSGTAEAESTTAIETSADDVETIDEDKVIDIGGCVFAPKSLASEVGMCSYFVVCRVESRGESYLYGKEFVQTDDKLSLQRQFRSMRTPYELEILEVFKGGDEVGEQLTAVTSGGEMGGYYAKGNYPPPTVGKVYVMPIGYLDLNDEYAIMGQGVAEVDLGDDGILSDNDTFTPTYFEGIWEGIDTVADLREYLAGAVDNIATDDISAGYD